MTLTLRQGRCASRKMKRLTSRCGYSQSQDPQARRLVVVTGAAAQDRMREARSRNDVSRFQDRATAEFLAGEAGNIRPMSLRLGDDHFCIAIGHREGSADYFYVADVVRGRAPPFDPEAVVDEYAMLLKQYNVAHVTGDAYSAEWCEAAFRKRNIRYVKSELPKSQLYIEALPHFTRHAISMPNHPKLLREPAAARAAHSRNSGRTS